jgi:acyl carrier protein
MTIFLDTNVTQQVTDLCRWIGDGGMAHIDIKMSLTQDLGFDSMKLMEFFAGIEDLYPGIALEEWFIEHSSGGRDTIGSVVYYLARVLTPVAAE